MTKYVIIQKRWKKILAIILFACALIGNFVVITVGLNLDFVKKAFQKDTGILRKLENKMWMC